MKQLRKMFIAGMAVLTLAVLFGGVPVKAASGVENMCENTSKNTKFYADLTGDNKKDTIRLKMTVDKECYFVQKLRIYVNGTKALTLRDKDSYYNVSATYIHMSKTKNFLQVTGRGDNDYCALNRIYRYDTKTKKMICVLDLSSDYLVSDGELVKATNKKIVLRHSYQPSESGQIRWNYTYVYKNKKFKRVSDTATVKSTLGKFVQKDGYEKYFAKNQFVAADSLRFYTSTKMKKTAFSAKKGDVLTLKKIKIHGKRMYLQFQKGKKTGWMEVNKSGSWNKTYFYGVRNRLAG